MLAGIHLSQIPALDYTESLFGERDLRSVTANTRQDGEEFLALAGRLELRIHTTTYDFDTIGQALGDMVEGRLSGSAVAVVHAPEVSAVVGGRATGADADSVVATPHEEIMTHTGAPVVVAVAAMQPGALRFAVGEARLVGARLRVVHAVALPAEAIAFYVGVNEKVLDEARIAGQAVLDDARRFIAEMDPTVEADYVLIEHEPVEALLPEAADARALIVGADDVPWLERLTHAKIASYLTQHAPCPVIVVPEPEAATGTGGDVVLVVDGATSASGPVSMAFEEADARGGGLRVLHTTPPGTPAADADAAGANVSEVLAGWRETHPDVTVRLSSPVGDVADAIAGATASAELVIVGRPPRRVHPPLSRPLAMKVLRHARCPVAIVPADYRPH